MFNFFKKVEAEEAYDLSNARQAQSDHTSPTFCPHCGSNPCIGSQPNCKGIVLDQDLHEEARNSNLHQRYNIIWKK